MKTNYYFYPQERSFVCRKIQNGETKGYIERYDEVQALISYFYHADFYVKANDQKIKLISDKYTITLKNDEHLFEFEIFDRLTYVIKKNVKANGYIFLEPPCTRKTVSRNNKHANKFIMKTLTLGISGLIALNLFMGMAQGETAPIDTPEPTQTIYIVPDDELSKYTIEPEEDIDTVYIDYENLYNEEKAQITKEKYFDKIKTSAEAYGLDPDLVLGMATQERGVHATEVDPGGGIGLMQIQYSVWAGHELTAKIWDDSKQEYVTKTLTVTDELMKDIDSNIEMGCMILQQCLKLSKYNILVATQMYNMGVGSMYDILDAYAADTGQTREDILNNPEDTGWLNYRTMKKGDPEYIENVNKWIADNSFAVTNVETGESVKLEISNGKTLT